MANKSKVINFIGPPVSYKTTLAAKLFYSFKEMDIAAEFLPEYARSFIACKRFSLLNNEKIELTDDDQLKIMEKQAFQEEVMYHSVGQDVFLISDSSPLNSLFYMTDDFRKNNARVKDLVSSYLKTNRMIFYCNIAPSKGVFDPNRVHSYDQSQVIGNKILGIIRDMAPELLNKLILLEGDFDYRYKNLLFNVLSNE